MQALDRVLDLKLIRHILACYVPLDAFRCSCVSRFWRPRWDEAFPFCFNLDLTRRNVSAEDVISIAKRILPTCECANIAFTGCLIGEAGVRAVADCLPAGLSSLCLDFSHGNFGEEGAMALAERVPAGLSSFSLTLIGTAGNYGIGQKGRQSVMERLPGRLLRLVKSRNLNFFVKFDGISFFRVRALSP